LRACMNSPPSRRRARHETSRRDPHAALASGRDQVASVTPA
jgi:hypothetical protein